MTFATTTARRLVPVLVGLALALAALVLPQQARAGYAVYPNGQAFPVTTTAWGTISSPRTLDFVVYLDELDSGPYVWISESPAMTSYGTPLGPGAGSCGPSELIPFGEPGKWVCRESTILMQPGRTYYWWLDFRRSDTADPFGQDRVSGPFAFTLLPAPAPAPPPSPAPTPPPVVPPVIDIPGSTRTALSAATLPASSAWDGSRSVKHTRLTSLVYRTLKQLGAPKTLAVACWSEADWFSVLDAEGDEPAHGDTRLLGFWKHSQPRWLHLAPSVCTQAQSLLDSGQANGPRAGALVTVLHEALHAHGISNEAQTNCFAVQLVPLAGSNLDLGERRSAYLGQLALRYVRSRAPAGYWNAASCRDGGR
jgi:hypothetical protein